MKKLYSELVAIAKSREMNEQIERNGADPVTTTHSKLTKLMESELAKCSKVIEAANTQLK